MPSTHATNEIKSGALPGSKEERWRNTLALWLFLFMVAVVPLPYGSVDFFWVTTWTLYSSLIVLLVSYHNVTRLGGLLLSANALLFLAYLVVVGFQSAVPGPFPRAIWAQVSDLLGTPVPPISASVRDGPLLYLGRPLLTALVFALALVQGQDRRHGLLILRVVVGLATVFGLIGLLALIVGIPTLRPFGGSALTAFFISKNTTATYLGSALLVAFSLAVVPVISGREHLMSRRRKGGTIERLGRDRAFFLACGAVLLLLLPLTESRAGLLWTLALLAATTLIVAHKQLFANRRGTLAVLAALLAGFALVYVISGEGWRERQAKVGFDTLGRLDFYKAMIGSVWENPWIGVGFGSFTESFPQLRPESIGILYFINIGHSTPVELAFEGGLPILVLTGAFMLLCGGVLLWGLRRHPADPVMTAALLVGLLGFLHSAGDFSLQMPGYMIIYLAIVGVGLGRALRIDQDEPAASSSSKVAAASAA